MSRPFLNPIFEPTVQADIGLAAGISTVPTLSGLGPISFGFLWPGLYDYCADPISTGYTICAGASVSTGYTTCGAIAATGWSNC
jgi:hypothetical protein